MQFISDIHAEKEAKGKPVVSFELFPPKTPEGEQKMFDKTLPTLLEMRPDYCSVTYGAGGGTRDKTLSIVERIQKQFDLPTMMHITCVNHTQEEIGAILTEAKSRGIDNILALRGDPPDKSEWAMTEGGFEFSYQLVRFIRDRNEFCIGVAGFPEGHIACKEGKRVDWRHLKGKIDSGADFVLTQLFFDNKDFAELQEYLHTQGVTVPVIPGIIPVQNSQQIKRFTAICGASIPHPLLKNLDALGDNEQAVREFGIDYATRQCRELLDRGALGLHFYTLNKGWATTRILQNLRLA